MAAYHRVDDLRHLRADCLHSGIRSGPNARYWVWESLYLYLLYLRLFCSYVVCLYCVGFSFFTMMPIDWLGRMSPKWPILCWVGHKTLTQAISHSGLWHCWFGSRMSIRPVNTGFSCANGSFLWTCSHLEHFSNSSEEGSLNRKHAILLSVTSFATVVWLHPMLVERKVGFCRRTRVVLPLLSRL